MRAFVVRPFGIKQGIDFERVHRDLISPALAAVSIEGDTTDEIVHAGGIRGDMFRLLAIADLVIVDISIHNANVFYELGIRHAIRARRTYLITAKVDRPPFDLLTERYLQYDAGDPAAALPALERGLRATLDSEETDSPVIALLHQDLITPDITRLLAPPADFHEEVNRAVQERRTGDLGLLSEEATKLVWGREGLRRVGSAQFELASYEPARLTWERLREYDPDDLEVNGRLATIYQKLGDLAKADEAVDRVLRDPEILGPERAELESLRASNLKTRWIAEWTNLENEHLRSERALNSPWLEKAYDSYWAAFAADRNHIYSGLNALAVAVVRLELCDRFPHVWAAKYDTDEDARSARERLQTQRSQLEAAVELARQSAQRMLEFSGRRDPWLSITTADLALLTGMTAERVANRYRNALVDAQPFHFAAVRRQLEVYTRLSVLVDAASAAMAVVREIAPPSAEPVAPRVFVFVGHRIDMPGRRRPRFPVSAEGVARRTISEAVAREHAIGTGEVVGMAGGASGGDILFHEVCAEQGIKTQLFIVGFRDAYLTASVQSGGPSWVKRFDDLHARLSTRVLGNSQGTLDLPRWLRPAKDYSIWQRNNRWLLNNALVYGARNVTLLALWNGEGGDGPGGTKDMVETARTRGAKVVTLDAAPLALIGNGR